MSNHKTLYILKASAGSGKTYALVLKYLTLALRTQQFDYYQRILAITFTNAAAAEMKERVLERLREIAGGEASVELTAKLVERCGIDTAELMSRARGVLKHMLHHYGKLSVLTIDSFTHRLVRSFARDLRLTSDFKIEVQSSAFHELLADECLDQIGRDDILTDYMTHFATENEEEGGSWQFRSSLIENARILEKESSERPMKNLSQLGYDEAKSLRKRISARFNEERDQLRGMVRYLLGLLEDHDLTPEDLAYGSRIFSPLLKPIETPVIKLSAYFVKLPNLDFWGTQRSSTDVRQKLIAFRHESIDLVNLIIAHNNPRNTARVKLMSTVKNSVFGLGLLRYMQQRAAEIKQEENILLISDLHKMVREVIEDSHAPFIYERIGNRFNHILFDEFQDTSELQWSNTIPLMHNSVAAGNESLIVGDSKQAIYRWRGGSSEQLIKLPGLLGAYDGSDAERIFKAGHDIEDLQDNRRSAGAIVRFNNRLFTLMKSSLGALENVYDKISQNVIRSDEGYVEVFAVDADQGEARSQFRLRSLKKIREIVGECEALGYRRGEIAILVRRAKDGGEIGRDLMCHDIPVTTRESFRAEHSPAVRALVNYAGYSLGQDIQLYGMFFAEAMCELRNIQLTECVQRNSEMMDGKLRVDISKICMELSGIDTIILSGGNIFDFFKNVMKRFNIPLDSGVDFLFDAVRQRCVGSNNSLSEFLKWWNDEKSKLYITEQKNPDAVQILTIHKSKGLQFPVVIYPRFASAPPKDNKIWLDLPEAEFGIPNIHMPIYGALDDIEELRPALSSEIDQSRLDNFNTFYVANTRAENRLYILQETYCKLAESAIFVETMEDEFLSFKSDRIWSDGDRNEVCNRKTGAESSEARQVTFPSTNGESILRLRRQQIEQTDEQRAGLIFHHCISLIQTVHDAEAALNKTFSKYNVHDDHERAILRRQIYALLEGNETGSWFQSNSLQYSERELCTSEGRILRPDRVVEFESEVWVIDFKTGAERSSHSDQMASYLNAVRETTSKSVLGALYYIGDGKCVHLS